MPTKRVVVLALIAATFGVLIAWVMIVAGQRAVDGPTGNSLFIERRNGEDVLCGTADGGVFCRPLNDPSQGFSPRLRR